MTFHAALVSAFCLVFGFSGPVFAQSFLFFGQVDASSATFANVENGVAASRCFGGKFGGGSGACAAGSDVVIEQRSDGFLRGRAETSETVETQAFSGRASAVSVVSEAFATRQASVPVTSTCSGNVEGFGQVICQSQSSRQDGRFNSFSQFFFD